MFAVRLFCQVNNAITCAAQTALVVGVDCSLRYKVVHFGYQLLVVGSATILQYATGQI